MDRSLVLRTSSDQVPPLTPVTSRADGRERLAA